VEGLSLQNGLADQPFSEERAQKSCARYLRLLLFLVGMHSMGLGVLIYFFTDLFYRVFFLVKIENLFFVRQSGLFLFCLGLFYIVPVIDLKKYHVVIYAVIATKFLAVLFLITNAALAPWPGILQVAAGLDGLMAILMGYLHYRSKLP
jgi:hypothetical protein